MPEQVEILTKVYGYVNQIKVYLAFKDIAGIWKVVNELTEYLVSVDCAPTPREPDSLKAGVLSLPDVVKSEGNSSA